MDTIRDVAYAPEYGFRGLGDVYVPKGNAAAKTVILIHGGGWNALDKNRMQRVAESLCRSGFGVYNINYRLLDQAPWPACGDDCLRAAEFVLSGKHPAFEKLDHSQVALIGASAGGHLALMTGLRLRSEQVWAIVDISGPTDLAQRATEKGIEFFQDKFFQRRPVTGEMLLAASPQRLVTAKSPPLLCVHSTNDELVPLSAAESILAAYHQAGARAELYSYSGPGHLHGIWAEDDQGQDFTASASPRLLPHLEEAIARFLGAARG
jgi:acetyl esterase/lipase